MLGNSDCRLGFIAMHKSIPDILKVLGNISTELLGPDSECILSKTSGNILYRYIFDDIKGQLPKIERFVINLIGQPVNWIKGKVHRVSWPIAPLTLCCHTCSYTRPAISSVSSSVNGGRGNSAYRLSRMNTWTSASVALFFVQSCML